MLKIKFNIALLCVLLCLCGCNVSENEQKQFMKLEAPKVDFIKYGEIDEIEEEETFILVIEAMDNNTIINKIVVNDGKCPVVMASYFGLFGVEEKYYKKYPENFIEDKTFETVYGKTFKELKFLNTKNGNKVDLKYDIFDNDDGVAYLNSLDEDSLKLYAFSFPANRLHSGNRGFYKTGEESGQIRCSKEDIQEVILKTNGGDFKYIF